MYFTYKKILIEILESLMRYKLLLLIDGLKLFANKEYLYGIERGYEYAMKDVKNILINLDS